MLCELRRKPGASGKLNYKSIKILSPASTYEVELQKNGSFINGNWHLCECDGDLKYLTEIEIDDALKHYELAQKSAIPNRLKVLLDKLIAMDDSIAMGLEVAELKRDAFNQIPDKWIELFNLLVKAGMFEVDLMGCDGSGHVIDIDSYDFVNGIRLIGEMGLGGVDDPELAQDILQGIAGKDYEVTVRGVGIDVGIEELLNIVTLLEDMVYGTYSSDDLREFVQKVLVDDRVPYKRLYGICKMVGKDKTKSWVSIREDITERLSRC